jgi:hypothetical protein
MNIFELIRFELHNVQKVMIDSTARLFLNDLYAKVEN